MGAEKRTEINNIDTGLWSGSQLYRFIKKLTVGLGPKKSSTAVYVLVRLIFAYEKRILRGKSHTDQSCLQLITKQSVNKRFKDIKVEIEAIKDRDPSDAIKKTLKILEDAEKEIYAEDIDDQRRRAKAPRRQNPVLAKAYHIRQRSPDFCFQDILDEIQRSTEFEFDEEAFCLPNDKFYKVSSLRSALSRKVNSRI
jgi:hypothetical protein